MNLQGAELDLFSSYVPLAFPKTTVTAFYCVPELEGHGGFPSRYLSFHSYSILVVSHCKLCFRGRGLLVLIFNYQLSLKNLVVFSTFTSGDLNCIWVVPEITLIMCLQIWIQKFSPALRILLLSSLNSRFSDKYSVTVSKEKSWVSKSGIHFSVYWEMCMFLLLCKNLELI